MIDRVFRRAWIPIAFVGLLLCLPVGCFWWATRPHKIAEVPNATGTLVAEVYQHDGIVSFGSVQYAVSLRPRSSALMAAFAPRTEVVVINDAYYQEQSGPHVTWATPTTLTVKSEAGRAFTTEDKPLPPVRQLQVRTSGKDTPVTVKLYLPAL